MITCECGSRINNIPTYLADLPIFDRCKSCSHTEIKPVIWPDEKQKPNERALSDVERRCSKCQQIRLLAEFGLPLANGKERKTCQLCANRNRDDARRLRARNT